MRRFTAPLAALAFLCSASAEPIPRYAASLAQYSNSVLVSEDAIRFRISVATDSAQGERSVRLGEVLLCKASECFRAPTPGYVDVSDTAAGTATAIADVVIPTVTITDVYFMEPSGGVAIAGHLKLEAPLVIEKGLHGIELLISVKKQNTAGKTTYVPSQSGNSYFNPESRLVHYLPSTRTVARLPLGTVVTIPAGAVDKPQVFHVNVHDRGELYPMIDIYPYIKLNTPMIVEAPAIPGGSSSREMIVPAYAPEDKQLYAPVNGPVTAKNGRVILTETGMVKSSTLEDSATAPLKAPPGGAANAAPGKTCAEYLAQPIVLGTIQLVTYKSGGVLWKGCQEIKPYVHILYINTLHKKIQFSIPYKRSNGGGHGPKLELLRITEFADHSMGLINGFMWDGDWGMIDGGSGKALGIVRAAGVKLGDNVEGGGVACNGCAIADNQFVMAFSADKARPVFLSTASSNDVGDDALNVVSSSTSVIKDGRCATPGGGNRWSAVGASYGRMVFISSTSDGKTTAEELCAVFKALAIKNAIRLDGGPSAAMVVSGTLLNP